MSNYIDGFVFAVPREQLDAYQKLAKSVAELWKTHGALDYREYIVDDATRDGTGSFEVVSSAWEDEAIVFGWVEFESREMRDLVNARVASDPRVPSSEALLEVGFDPSSMLYAGFRAFVKGTPR